MAAPASGASAPREIDASLAAPSTSSPSSTSPNPHRAPPTPLEAKYRGAVMEDLDPPAALSVHPADSCASALQRGDERDYTHLTVVESETRALRGYVSMPRLRELLASGTVAPSDPVEQAMRRFRRKGARYRVITMETPLAELEQFFETQEGKEEDFAVVTDARRRFVLGVATRGDLDEFVKRRPA